MSKYTMPENVKEISMSKPIKESLFKSFISDEMTVKEAKEFTKEVNNRFMYIVYKIGEMTSFEVKWFDYENENGEYSPGNFDTEKYSENVNYTGEFYYEKGERFSKYDDSFPTFWFYKEFENSLKNEVNEYFSQKKNTEKEEQENIKKRENEISQIKEKILSKLTDEEKLYIKFCTISEIEENKKIELNKSKKDIAKFIKIMKEKNVDISALYKKYRDKQKMPISFEKWIEKNKNSLEF